MSEDNNLSFGYVACDEEFKFYGSEIYIPAKFPQTEVEKAFVTRVVNYGKLVFYTLPNDDWEYRIRVEDVVILKLETKVTEIPIVEEESKPIGIPYIHISDLAVKYKREGLDRQAAWKQYITDTILSKKYRTEEVDANVFFRCYFDILI